MAENLEGYEAVLLDLKKERDELERLIRAMELRVTVKRKAAQDRNAAAALFAPDDDEVVVFNADRAVTIYEGSERLLRDAHRPLHAKQLVEGLARMGKITSVNSVVGALPQDTKGRFRKVSPATFGLVEWEQRTDGT